MFNYNVRKRKFPVTGNALKPVFEGVLLVSQPVLEMDLIPPLHQKKTIKKNPKPNNPKPNPKFQYFFLALDLLKTSPHPRSQPLPTRAGGEAAGAEDLPRTNETDFPGGWPGPFGEGGDPGGAAAGDAEGRRAGGRATGGGRGTAREGGRVSRGGRRGTCRAPVAAGTAGRWR